MPRKMRRPKSYWKLATLLICLAFGICLAWYGFKGRLKYPALWTVGYSVLLWVLVRSNISGSRAPGKGSEIGVWGRFSDIVKGVALMFAGVGLAGIALGLVPQTPVGPAIVLVPFAAFLLVGGFFFVRGYMKTLTV